ncbi:MAG: hypothetical protein WC718_09230 [Phycisphaerales bacterium]
MRSVQRAISQAGRRLTLMDFFAGLVVAVTVGLGVAMLTRIVERVLGVHALFAPWWGRGAMIAGGVALLSAVVWTIARRRGRLRVAQELDERAGLRETLSTAMYVQRETDPWSQAVVAEADRMAGSVKVGQAIPIQAPKLWPAPIFASVALALVWFTVPNMDLLGATKREVAKQQKQDEVAQVKADIQTKQDKLKELLAKAKVDFVDEKTEEAKQELEAKENDPEAMRRAAVRELTALTEKLADQKDGEKAAQTEALKEAMRQLKRPDAGPLDEFSRQMARGDFNKAQEALAELGKKMADAGTSPEEKEQAKKQAENLAKQLAELAKDKEQLAKKLESAGLDKKQAEEIAKQAASGDPEQVQKALEKAAGLSPEDQKKLLDMAKAQMKAQQQAQNMGEAMSKMASGMTQEGMQQDGQQGMQEMQGELSEAEMMQNDMQQLDAALSEAKKQLSEMAGETMGGDQPGGKGNKSGNGDKSGGGWKEGGQANGQGKSGGNRGHGDGSASPEGEAVDYKVDRVKANTQTTGGPIIGSRLVYGEKVKGESVAEFAAVAANSEQRASEAIENNQVPRELQSAVKNYFGRLNQKVKVEKPAEKPADAPK